jgi:hypothetical protein
VPAADDADLLLFSAETEQGDAPMETLEVREIFTNALRYWERGRIFYNLALAAVVVTIFLVKLPASRSLHSPDLLLQLFILMVLANVAYCAAYPVDVMVQCSGFRSTWLRIRWCLLLIGTMFAATVAQFIARGLFGGAS